MANKKNITMDEKTLKEHARHAEDFYNKNTDEKRELIYLISTFLKEYGGKIDFHVESEYDEEDLLMVLSFVEFGYESHTYVLEHLELDEIDRVNVNLHRYNYTGFGEYQTVTLWYLSVDDLIRIYLEMVNLIEEKMAEETETIVE